MIIDKKSFTLVKAIAEFSKELGIKVIAEFVSSKEIFDALKTLSIDEYQGFYFSVPSRSLELTTTEWSWKFKKGTSIFML